MRRLRGRSGITSVPGWRAQINKVIVSIPVFFSRFSSRARVAARKYRGCDHDIDRPVDGVKSPFGYSPLLYHDHPPVSDFRGHGTMMLSRKNTKRDFEDTEQEGVCVPSLSRQKGAHKTAGEFIKTQWNPPLQPLLSCTRATLEKTKGPNQVLLQFSLWTPTIPQNVTRRTPTTIRFLMGRENEQVSSAKNPNC